MDPPAGMCSTTFCARLIIPMMLTLKVCSRRSREICVKSSTASPYMHAHMLSARSQHWLCMLQRHVGWSACPCLRPSHQLLRGLDSIVYKQAFCCIGCSTWYEALLTRMSICPNSSTVFATTFLQETTLQPTSLGPCCRLYPDS